MLKLMRATAPLASSSLRHVSSRLIINRLSSSPSIFLIRPHYPLPRSFTSSAVLCAPPLSASVSAKLAQLRSDADAYPSSPNHQYKYLLALGRVDPKAVIRRMDLGQHAQGAGALLEYTKAKKSIAASEGGDASNNHYAQHQQHPPSHNPYAFSATGIAPDSKDSAPLGSMSNPLSLGITPPSVELKDVLLSTLKRWVVGALFVGVFIYAMSYSNAGAGLGSGPTKDFLSRTETGVTFNDVKGCDEAKSELQEIVDYLKNPKKYERLGAQMTKGVLLTGPPGTGKTLLAKAVAGEAGVAFFACSGSDFDEMYVGVGASRVRDLFAAARKQKKAIIFIDEIDAMGGSRDNIGNANSRGTLNALLTEMDGFSGNASIVVIGATNHDGNLDAALVRPGRFDRKVAVSLPDSIGRLAILEHYAASMKLDKSANLKLLSKSTVGMSGADLKNLLNVAAIRASKNNRPTIDHDELEYAFDKILMGAERSFTQSAEVRANTAYHEAGHTIMLLFTPGAPPLHKVTILPRGRALGAMFYLPLNEHNIYTKAEISAQIDIMMGGRVAEQLLNGVSQITSGASNDLERASDMVRTMVTRYGMGESTSSFTLPSVGRGVNASQVVAPETLARIDAEVALMLKDSYARALDVVTKHKVEWDRLAQALIEHEELDANQVMQAIRGEKVTRKVVNKFKPEEKQPTKKDDAPADATKGIKLPIPAAAATPVQK